jgi:hypothetical protein
MWTIRSEAVQPGSLDRYAVDLNGLPASYADVLRGWREDADFRSLFGRTLAECQFQAFRWETPPVTTSTASRPFEFVLLNSPGLAPYPDSGAFLEHFGGDAGDGVVVFPNLGRDAILVVPCRLADESAYGHLAAFVRGAPKVQQQALWQAIGKAMMERVGHRPVWLSTAGAGVSWLHVRLDDRPKYYGHGPYRGVP